MIESISILDQEILLAINSITGNAFVDSLMVLISSRVVWIPLYVFLTYSVFRKFGVASTLWILVSAGVLVVLTDQVSVHFFKNVFLRLRPCHNPALEDVLYLASGRCGGQYGFVSSHATNVFGLSAFIIMLFGRTNPIWYLMFLWAGLVSFSRIYLAVHYPLDVLAGAVLGVLIGIGIATLTKKIVD